MPSIADLDGSISPRDDPLHYPGTTLPQSYLWLDSWVYGLSWTPRAGLGHWQPKLDGGPLGAIDSVPVRLSGVLAALGVAGVEARYPVLAYGSNAAPTQLLDKFRRLEAGDRVMPVTTGRVVGFALAHSAHVSNPGYLPYVLVDGGDAAALEVRVLWLDDDQLAALTETEPNYALTPVNGSRYPLTLESGKPVPRYSAYRGSWGALRWPGDNSHAPAGTQEVVHGRLAQLDWFRQLIGRVDIPAQVRLLRQDKVLRDRVRDELAARGMAVADGWIAP